MKKKTILKILLIIAVAILIISTIVPNCLAIDTSKWDNMYNGGDMPTKLSDIGGTIMGILQVAGTGIAVVMLVIIGIKYITASANEKAQLKGQLTGFAIGALLLFAGSNIAAIVIQTIFEVTK